MLRSTGDTRPRGHRSLCGNPRVRWPERYAFGGSAGASGRLQKGPDQSRERELGLAGSGSSRRAPSARWRSISVGWGARGQAGGGGHFHKAQGRGGRCRQGAQAGGRSGHSAFSNPCPVTVNAWRPVPAVTRRLTRSLAPKEVRECVRSGSCGSGASAQTGPPSGPVVVRRAQRL